MKKTLIALMALAGVAAADTITEDTTITAPANLYAGAFDFSFTLTETSIVTGNYDILLAYYQVNSGAYTVNAFQLSNTGVLTLNRGGGLTLTDGALTNDSTLGTANDASTFTVVGGTDAYTLTTPGTYTVDYLGGTNGEAAADLYLDGVKVAAFTGGSHNMNGAQAGGLTLNVKVNDAYVVAPAVPEPTTATLSLLALAGLAARRRRR